jgi:hypothetical protein
MRVKATVGIVSVLSGAALAAWLASGHQAEERVEPNRQAPSKKDSDLVWDLGPLPDQGSSPKEPVDSLSPPTTYPDTAAGQAAKDSLAQPGDWVTPPAFSKSDEQPPSPDP